MNIDWKNLGFDIIKTNCYVKYTWTEGKGWNTGEEACFFLINQVYGESKISVDLYASAFHYGQACFEGCKAFYQVDGKIRIFRPELNAIRMQESCKAVSMPFPPVEMFLEGVVRCVALNRDFVPPASSNGSLYIRPFVIGSGGVLGLQPSKEYFFIVLVNPVGDYYKGGLGKPGKALIQYGFDRAAPRGNGHVKLAGNYAPVIHPTAKAKEKGYTLNLFLDPKQGRFVEEFATSNFVGLSKADANGKRTFTTPKSRSILASVTNRSLSELAAKKFGWSVSRRQVEWSEVMAGSFDEIAAVGTAVVITPIQQIDREVMDDNTPETFEELTDIETLWNDDIIVTNTTLESAICKTSDFAGVKQLYTEYRQIQYGNVPDIFKWLYPSKGI